MDKLSNEGRINFLNNLRTGMSALGFGFSLEQITMFAKMYEKVFEKGDQTNLEDVATIQSEVQDLFHKYPTELEEKSKSNTDNVDIK